MHKSCIFEMLATILSKNFFGVCEVAIFWRHSANFYLNNLRIGFFYSFSNQYFVCTKGFTFLKIPTFLK
jgi:hypothetical protein